MVPLSEEINMLPCAPRSVLGEPDDRVGWH
jgi:hypothetical protein